MLNAKPLAIDGVVLVSPTRFEDGRGYFTETFNARDFNDAVGLDVQFVQDNESLSVDKGTVRGLHFQLPPAAQGKLVRVLAGRIADVIVDIRKSSPSYRNHQIIELNASSGEQLWLPAGLAHGFCTLEPETVISYKVTDFYNRDADRSLHWMDPVLGIDWPVTQECAVLSEKDSEAPNLDELERAGHVFA